MVADAIVQDAVPRLRLQQPQPPPRRLIILLQQPPVAIMLIKPPQEKRVRGAPAHRPRAFPQPLVADPHEGRGLREPAIRAHRVGQVPHRLGIKTPHIKVEQGHLAGRYDVAPVAELLAVRAIGLHAEQVAQLRPEHHLLDPVELLVGAGERTHRRHIRVKPQPVQRCQRRLPRVARHLDIAEPMERKPRRVDFPPLPLEDVVIHLPGRFGRALPVVTVVAAAAFNLAADGGHPVEGAVRVKQLSVAQFHARARRPLNAQPRPARKVLPEIKDMDARLRLGEFDGLEHARHANRRRILRLQGAQFAAGGLRRFPVRIIKAGLIPAGLLPPRVIHLAQVHAIAPDGAGAGLPTDIRAQRLRGSVRQLDP